MGRNNLSDPVRLQSDVAAAIKSLGSDKYIVLTILNGDFSGTEARGAPGYKTIMDLNRLFMFRYPGHVVDIRSFLVSLYDPSDPQDVLDHASDIPPSSLRAHWSGGIDRLHLSPEANVRVAQRVAQSIRERGW